MRRMMLSLAAGATLLSGCASIGPFAYEPSADIDKVARIENAAKAVGVNVYWFNFPQKSSSLVN